MIVECLLFGTIGLAARWLHKSESERDNQPLSRDETRAALANRYSGKRMTVEQRATMKREIDNET